MNNYFDISNETIILTGSSGILGNEYCKSLLEHGALVIGIDNQESNETSKLKAKYPDNFFFYKCDITEKSEVMNTNIKIKEENLVPTILINNAAIDNPPNALNFTGKFEDFSEDEWDKVNDVNLKGAFLCSQIFGSGFAERLHGSIINISSIYGIVSPDQSLYEYKRKNGKEFYKPVAYSVTKGGILQLTKYLAVYWAAKNIRVNSLVLAGVLGNQDQDFIDLYCKRIPAGRMAEVDEYNGALIFLCSSASRYMTGSNIVIDGGWTSI